MSIDSISEKIDAAGRLVGKKITWAGMDPKTERFYILVDGLQGLVVEDVSQVDFLEDGVEVAGDIVKGQLALAKSVLALSSLEGIGDTRPKSAEKQIGGEDGGDPGKGPDKPEPSQGDVLGDGQGEAQKDAQPGSEGGANPQG